ncbi:CoA transferase [Rhizorhabdus wittichii DC-6]|uniref:CaiB/BaiF CoA transferase family protein n=1 Tax=Rhizorhabdus wittichii TaxID=160791 RepID=UPI000376B66C|nr:CaiB/BaiF CoA-transferase family protein [Rhizorhabdus wittichii]ARR55120.1 CoA transferase [Rhizorhabdus wittichii DC-6]
MSGSGPLHGVRVLEFAGIGPTPFCAMLLSDLGADVLRIDRPGTPGAYATEVLARGRRSIAIDLKDKAGIEACRELARSADVLIEGFRPGVMERLGLGPEEMAEINPRLVYGRMTGWGQTGPLAKVAGHDINYIAITGALGAIGPADRPPTPPLNLLGDFGGGSLYLALGIVSALLERERSQLGQVIDAAIVDGVASLFGMHAGFVGAGMAGGRGQNMLDGSANYYRCYECADGKYVAVGAFEPHFYALLLQSMGLDAPALKSQSQEDWESVGARLSEIFLTRTQREWSEMLEGTDACFAPVLSFEDAVKHPHMAARNSYVTAFGITQPAPAPRFSRTPGEIQGPPTRTNDGGREAALEWGLPPSVIEAAARP